MHENNIFLFLKIIFDIKTIPKKINFKRKTNFKKSRNTVSTAKTNTPLFLLASFFCSGNIQSYNSQWALSSLLIHFVDATSSYTIIKLNSEILNITNLSGKLRNYIHNKLFFIIVFPRGYFTRFKWKCLALTEATRKCTPPTTIKGNDKPTAQSISGYDTQTLEWVKSTPRPTLWADVEQSSKHLNRVCNKRFGHKGKTGRVKYSLLHSLKIKTHSFASILTCKKQYVFFKQIKLATRRSICLDWQLIYQRKMSRTKKKVKSSVEWLFKLRKTMTKRKWIRLKLVFDIWLSRSNFQLCPFFSLHHLRL